MRNKITSESIQDVVGMMKHRSGPPKEKSNGERPEMDWIERTSHKRVTTWDNKERTYTHVSNVQSMLHLLHLCSMPPKKEEMPGNLPLFFLLPDLRLVLFLYPHISFCDLLRASHNTGYSKWSRCIQYVHSSSQNLANPRTCLAEQAL